MSRSNGAARAATTSHAEQYRLAGRGGRWTAWTIVAGRSSGRAVQEDPRDYFPASAGIPGEWPCSSSSVTEPDWLAALEVAFTPPPGTPERRADEDPWDGEPPKARAPAPHLRRAAVAAPRDRGAGGQRPDAAAGVGRRRRCGTPRTRASSACCRLRDRKVLDAAGFLLHEAEDPNDLLGADGD